MPSSQHPGPPAGPRAASVAPAQLLEQLEQGMAGRLQPTLAATLQAAARELEARRAAEPAADRLADQLTGLRILSRYVGVSERRWRKWFARGFNGWPQPPRPMADDAYALVSDDELQSQLVGQPVIEALERRFSDPLDVIDKRLWSLAAQLGGQVRPHNPVAPRHVVEAFLHAFPATEVDAPLRAGLLRHFERSVAACLGDAYAWCNTLLSEAGHSLVGTGDYALLMAGQPPSGNGGGKADLWAEHNALAPAAGSTWREQPGHKRPAPRRTPSDAVRGNALRQRMRGLRPPSPAERRAMRLEEFLAVLSLLQGEPAPALATEGCAQRLRVRLAEVAARLGIDPATAAPAPEQDDAVELVGRLFDDLVASHALSDQAAARLSRLPLPYLRLALTDPYLFERPPSPALGVLDRLLRLWDANPCRSGAETELHELADAVADDIAEHFHGDEQVFARALEQLEQVLEPLQRRAAVAERRVGQAIEGRERLQAARAEADRHLAERLRAPMLDRVGGFLREQWRQALVQAWLRDGAQSQRYADLLALGEAVVRIDADAAHARGHAVADALLALEAPLRACYVACGLDEGGSQVLLAQLVAELANPDAPRSPQRFEPLLEGGHDPAAGNPDEPVPATVGQRVVRTLDDGSAQALRLAWRSPLGGDLLLVNAHGGRELLLGAREFARMLETGRLRLRAADGPVEDALRRLEAAPD
ncbi:DUF1631 family protein [Luteimonas sp. RD2P54]|uniref:DUF1631 family protein n=1 Tax=Luteimonas endophytica TaxID=3042023 RepID=A0ABT6J5P0_9GAMM|nr:DUF1631 family protein [Luteimonas endophytica]MDH5822151.1 DUF1631 family protein [Luteimonas endophytica]